MEKVKLKEISRQFVIAPLVRTTERII